MAFREQTLFQAPSRGRIDRTHRPAHQSQAGHKYFYSVGGTPSKKAVAATAAAAAAAKSSGTVAPVAAAATTDAEERTGRRGDQQLCDSAASRGGQPNPLLGARRPRTKNATAMAVRDAYKKFTAGRATDFWLLLGDNAYPEGTDADYQKAVFEMYPEFLRTSALWTTLGNHDGKSANSITQSGVYYDISLCPRAARPAASRRVPRPTILSTTPTFT